MRNSPFRANAVWSAGNMWRHLQTCVVRKYVANGFQRGILSPGITPRHRHLAGEVLAPMSARKNRRTLRLPTLSVPRRADPPRPLRKIRNGVSALGVVPRVVLAEQILAIV